MALGLRQRSNVKLFFFLLHEKKIRFSLPWDQSTVAGYVKEILYSVVTGGDYILCAGVFIFFFISLCRYHCAFYEMYHDLLYRWDYKDGNANHQQHLAQIIHFHVLIKEYALQIWEY